jgi:sarcosine oxidase subunit gamma
LPITVAGTVLSEPAFSRITSIAPLAGQDGAVADALHALGLDWPAIGQVVTNGGASCLWAGRRLAFLLGADPTGFDDIAALTDQSDAWARMRLAGPAATAALARHVPLDLGPAAFPTGSVARTTLNHMMALLHRSDADAFDIWVVRSMAGTAVHDLHRALAALAARQAVAQT